MRNILNIIVLCCLCVTTVQAQKPKLMLPIGHTDEILCAQFSPDGKKVVTGSIDKTLKIWDAQTGVLLSNLKSHSDNVTDVSFSPDGTRILSVSLDGTAKLWDAINGILLFTLADPWGHSLFTASFNKDGTKFITTTKRNPIGYTDPKSLAAVNIYDVASYKVINRIEVSALYAKFSPDEKSILCWGGSVKGLAVWNVTVPGGKLIGSPLLINNLTQQNDVVTAGFSPDSTMGYCVLKKHALWEYGLYLWKIKKQSLYTDKYRIATKSFFEKNNRAGLALITAENRDQAVLTESDNIFEPDLHFKDSVSFVNFSPDNQKLVIGSASGTTVDVYKLIKFPGKPEKNDSLVFQKKIVPRDGSISMVSFSPDSKRMISSHENKSLIWDLSPDKTIPLGQVEFFEPVSMARFNNDGSKILAVPASTYAQIWDANTYEFVSELSGHTSTTYSQEFSPDGKYLLAATGRSPMIWDNNNGQLVKIFAGENKHTDEVNYAKYSPDGKLVITASNDLTAKIWNTASGKWITDLTGHADAVLYAAFSRNSKRIVTTSSDSTIGLWNWDSVLQKVKLIKLLKGHKGVPRIALFSKDGKKLVTVSANKDQIKMWNADNGELLFTIESKKNPKLSKQIGDSIMSVLFSPDDKQLLTTSYSKDGLYGKGPQIWDVNDGHLISHADLYHVTSEVMARGRREEDDEAMDAVQGACIAYYSPDGNRILYLSNTITYGIGYGINGGRIVDAKTFKTLARLKGLGGLHQFVNDVSFSSDGSHVALAFVDNTIRVFDMATGNKKYDLEGHSGDVFTAMFSPNNKYIVSSSEDNTFKKWDAATGELLYTFFAVDSSDYLILDKYERFDGTPAAKELLYFSCGTEMIKLEQFETLSWEPDLVKKILKLNKEPITARKISEIDICNVTPEVIHTPSPNGPYKYLIIPQKGKLGEVEVFVNDKIIKVYKPAGLSTIPQGYVLQLDSMYVASFFSNIANNTVMVRATTENEAMTSRGVTLVSHNEVKKKNTPNMYIVSVGINDYKGKAIHLNYAANDAASFHSAITASAKKLLDSTDGLDHVRATLFNTEPENLNRPSKTAIRQKMKEIAQLALPDDIFIFFFAGHGVLQNGQKSFYLLTAEATGLDMAGVEKEVAISTDELNEWMRQIKANKQLLILDACNSGAAIDGLADLISKRDVPADQVRALEGLKDKNGTFILSASASNQSAYETSQFGQGLLTYSLLSGIKNQDGLRDYKYLDVTNWFRKTSDNVRELAKEIGGRQEPQVFGNKNQTSFDVGLVDQEVMNGIKLATRKKIMSRSVLYTGDPSMLIDDLQLGPEIDRELNNRSASGLQNPFTYIENNLASETYTIRGAYEVSGQNISVRLSLVSKKAKVQEIIEKGTLDTKVELAKKIVDDVVAYMNTLSK